MGFIESIFEKAKSEKKRVAVPECTNENMMRAAARAHQDGLAEVVFVGDSEEIQSVAEENGIRIEGIEIADTGNTEYQNEILDRFGELPKRMLRKGYLSKSITKPLYMALVMEAVGDVDCTYGGLDATTTEFVMVASGILGLAPGCTNASALALIEMEDYEGKQGNLFGMSDGAVTTDPTSAQLASIAMASCDTFTALTGDTARCALLSYSTDGSGEGPSVERVREARDIARDKRPELFIDGEFQVDTAILPKVAAKKMKRESEVAGIANVLVFPDAAACNIGSKLVSMFAKCKGYGPVYQGFGKTVLDCSRGATEDNIYTNFAFCSVMAQYDAKKEY